MSALEIVPMDGAQRRQRVIVDGQFAGWVVRTSQERWYGSRKHGTTEDSRKMSYGFHSVERAAQWVAESTNG